MKALAPSPQHRYSTARELDCALSAFNGGLRRQRSWTKPTVMAGSVLAVVFGVLFGGVLGTPQDSDPGDVAATTMPGSAARFSKTPDERLNLEVHSVAESLKGKPDSELRDYRLRLDAHDFPVDVTPHSAAKGYVSVLLREYGEAIMPLRAAARNNKSGDEGIAIWCNLGYCYLQQRKYSAAERTLDTALELAPDHAQSLFLRSIVELEMAHKDGRQVKLDYLDRLLYSHTELSARLVRAAVAYERALVADDSRRPNGGDVAGDYKRRTLEFGADVLSLPDGASPLRFVHDPATVPLPHANDPRAAQLGLPVDQAVLTRDDSDDIESIAG